MELASTVHATVVVKRSYRAPPARVFAAWRDTKLLSRWHMPGDGSWKAEILVHDFRVGGGRRMVFGPPGETPFSEDCRYEDIVEDQRICYAMTIANGERRITTSMVTVELAARADGTELVVTDQMVILDGGDTSGEREHGWGETLDKLTPELLALAAPQPAR